MAPHVRKIKVRLGHLVISTNTSISSFRNDPKIKTLLTGSTNTCGICLCLKFIYIVTLKAYVSIKVTNNFADSNFFAAWALINIYFN